MTAMITMPNDFISLSLSHSFYLSIHLSISFFVCASCRVQILSNRNIASALVNYQNGAFMAPQSSQPTVPSVPIPRNSQPPAPMSSQQLQPNQSMLCNGNYRPNVINSDQNYAKKSYNYMASPNYLQYENTYQKYKNIYHSKDVSNFRDGNGGPSNENAAAQHQMYNYHRRDYTDDDTEVDLDADRRVTRENKTNNIAMQQTLSSDDEGGFRRDVPIGKNQFNFTAAGGSNVVNNMNGNNANSINYSTKEVEPLLQTGNYNQYQMEPKVSVNGQFWLHSSIHSFPVLFFAQIMQGSAQMRYEAPHYACPGAMIPMQNIQSPYGPSHPEKHLNNNYHQQQQHQIYQQHRNVPTPSVRPYMKPLPKLPPNIGKSKSHSLRIHMKFKWKFPFFRRGSRTIIHWRHKLATVFAKP